MSRIHKKKGLEFLFDVLSKLESQNFELIICGSGEKKYTNEIVKLCKSLRLNDQIQFKGFVTGEEKIKTIKESDLFILPSKFENFGNIVLEVLQYSTPILISKNIFIWREISAHNVGWFLELEKQKWIDTLNQIINNRELLEIDSDEFLSVVNKYSYNILAKGYKEMLVQ